MKNTTLSLAIIIACHNRKKLTLDCLERIYQQSGVEDMFSLDVYLVDDGSTDGTASAVEECFPQVILIGGTGNLFWNRGMHLAFQTAMEKGKHNFYVWLNDDTYIFPDALMRLLGCYESLSSKHGDKIIVSGPTQDPDTREFTYGGVVRLPRWYGWKFKRVPPSLDSPIEVHATNGNCVLIPQLIADDFGNLDSVFTHKWGDHDYCFRAIENGCQVWLLESYIGTCRWNSDKGTWKDTDLPLFDRYRKLWAPSGLMPNDYWVYLKRHRGWLWIFYWIAPFIRILTSRLKKQ